jgi:uncharacterized membrane protein YhaH (DUF805 family)
VAGGNRETGGADPGQQLVDGPAAASHDVSVGCDLTIGYNISAEAFKGGGSMNFPQAVATVLKKYAVFSGRASRSEYWYFVLFYFLGSIAASILDAVVFQSTDKRVFSTIFALIMFLPILGVEIRRLHDVDRRGWWIFIKITIIGMIYPLLVWECRKGTAGPNRFGDDPAGLGWVVSQFE